jgi:hypothetical protein
LDVVAGGDDLRRQLRDPAQHHRRARARAPPRALTATTQTPLLERIRAQIGWQGPVRTTTVEAGHVSRFCAAIGDPNPRWREEAPPTFLVALGTEVPDIPEVLEYGKGWLNAGDRFEYEEPVRPGDTISARITLVDAYEKQGASGSLLFLVFETEFINQEGRAAGRVRGTRIRR